MGPAHKGAAHRLLGQDVVVNDNVTMVDGARDELRRSELRTVLSVRNGGERRQRAGIENGAGITADTA